MDSETIVLLRLLLYAPRPIDQRVIIWLGTQAMREWDKASRILAQQRTAEAKVQPRRYADSFLTGGK